MVKRIKDSPVSPRVFGRVQTIIGSRVGRSLGQEGKLAEGVGVVGYRTDREGGGSGDGRTGGEGRL